MPDPDCDRRLSEFEMHHAETIVYRELREQSEKEDRLRRDKLADEIRSDISEIKEFMVQQKTFIGAVIFIVGGIFSVGAVFYEKLFGSG